MWGAAIEHEANEGAGEGTLKIQAAGRAIDGGQARLAFFVWTGLDKALPQPIPTKHGHHSRYYSKATMKAPVCQPNGSKQVRANANQR
jgi:hypothetical protein